MTIAERMERMEAEVARLTAVINELSAGQKQLVSQKEAAEILGKRSATITEWRRKGILRNYAPKGSRPLYLITELKRFINN